MNTWQERAIQIGIDNAVGHLNAAKLLVNYGQLERASKYLDAAALSAQSVISDIVGEESAASEAFARYESTVDSLQKFENDRIEKAQEQK